MGKVSRKTAFQATREVIGPEVCPIVRDIKPEVSPEAADKLEGVTATTHHLRHAVASLLLLYTREDLTHCPNCEERLPRHNAACHVGLLLEAMGWRPRQDSNLQPSD